jgi:hypothetical protein
MPDRRRRQQRKPAAVQAPAGKRQPTKSVSVVGGRNPRAVEQPRTPEALSWRVNDMDLGGPWGWHLADEKVLRLVREKLGSFETMTWGELLGDKHKPIPVEHLCPKARARLVDIERDDIPELGELRVGNKPRIWGWLQGDVMHLLWWDPEHEVCPSKLRNT